MAIARWGSETLEVYALGDSPAVIYPKDDEPIVVYDDRLDHVGVAERDAYRGHLRSGGGYGDRLSSLVAELQLAERKGRNRPDGYWIAESDPSAGAEAARASRPLPSVETVLLMSDGAAALVLEYQLLGWADVLRKVRAHGPDAAFRALHDVELSDQDGVRWPRAKCHDDKSLIMVSRHTEGTSQPAM